MIDRGWTSYIQQFLHFHFWSMEVLSCQNVFLHLWSMEVLWCQNMFSHLWPMGALGCQNVFLHLWSIEAYCCQNVFLLYIFANHWNIYQWFLFSPKLSVLWSFSLANFKKETYFSTCNSWNIYPLNS